MNILKIDVGLTEDISLNNLNNSLSSFLNNAMLKNEKLKIFHKSKDKFKFYSFSTLHPIEKDSIYKKGCFYSFEIKSPNKNFLIDLQKVLNRHSTQNIMCFNTSIITMNIKHINTIQTLTPSVITHNNNTWEKLNFILVKDKIIKNSIRKYNAFYNENIDENFDFISSIEFLNTYPIKINYKNTKIYGNKYNLTINDDDLSQKIAKFVCQTGLLEKNSLGLGFCKGF